jgi:hypothetical protein
LVNEFIPLPDRNWVGYSEVNDITSYRSLEITNSKVKDIYEKGCGKFPINKAYIGLAGINDFNEFWLAMESGQTKAIQMGEVYGIKSLVSRDVEAVVFNWNDTGNIEALNKTRDLYREKGGPSILEKNNECIWFVGGNVIKFSDDKKFIANRVERAKDLEQFVPKITGVRPNMYRYERADGRVFSEVVNIPLFASLLEHVGSFWELKKLTKQDKKIFNDICLHFYRDKTRERVQKFYENFSRQDGTESINGLKMPFLADLLKSVDWGWLANGLAGRFHGDFHFENILWKSLTKSFVFLDWRQDFGGNLTVGDIYYDFAKLHHGLIISHDVISRDLYSVEWRPSEINYNFMRKALHVECEIYFYQWLERHGYDTKKVKIITALIYLNIAALHHEPYGLLLFALGKSMLEKELNQ